MTLFSFLLLAVTGILTPTRPEVGKPVSWEFEMTEKEASSFDEAIDWLNEFRTRRNLWNKFLLTMEEVELPQSQVGVRFIFNYKDTSWPFDDYGHLWYDNRFVREDEKEGLDILENWLKELVAKSPYAGFEWGKEEGETITFRGYSDGRFQAIDFLLMRVCEGTDIHPRLLKSMLIEDYWETYPENLDEAAVTQELEKVEKLDPSSKYAGRIFKRFRNPGMFVPVVRRKTTENGQT